MPPPPLPARTDVPSSGSPAITPPLTTTLLQGPLRPTPIPCAVAPPTRAPRNTRNAHSKQPAREKASKPPRPAPRAPRSSSPARNTTPLGRPALFLNRILPLIPLGAFTFAPWHLGVHPASRNPRDRDPPGPPRDPVGTFLGPLWDPVGTSLGPLRDPERTHFSHPAARPDPPNPRPRHHLRLPRPCQATFFSPRPADVSTATGIIWHSTPPAVQSLRGESRRPGCGLPNQVTRGG
jgi:hypothetical protein